MAGTPWEASERRDLASGTTPGEMLTGMGGAVGLGHACGRRIAPAFAAIHGGPDVLVLRETAEPELTIGLD